MKIVSITPKFTNCYLVQINPGWLMIDTDWPETLPQLSRLLKAQAIQISEISHLIITHFHPDHTGTVQNLKELGIKLTLLENQVSYINGVNQFFHKNPTYDFKDIGTGDNLIVTNLESRRLFKTMGLEGEIISTPGHSDDSISLILDEGCAFTGDLPAFPLMKAYNDPTIEDSWNSIQSHGVDRIYPAHGSPYSLYA